MFKGENLHISNLPRLAVFNTMEFQDVSCYFFGKTHPTILPLAVCVFLPCQQCC